ncbi:hypothetical protein [Aureimonas frigidaquae]|uniref:hypothetical protein n=1 Tax=Aureimonas frigidaquae TaxID=424757 RepID=UPI000A828358|nr:hypothetical protein [Aureimonas frigidaquae]
MSGRPQGGAKRGELALARLGAGLSIVIVLAAILGVGPFAGTSDHLPRPDLVSALR